MTLLRSFDHFLAHASSPGQKAFGDFCDENQWWLDDYALFMAILEANGQGNWSLWEPDLARCRREAIQRWKDKHCESIELAKYVQFIFFSQWNRLREFARQNGVQILGDLPILVAYESVDV